MEIGKLTPVDPRTVWQYEALNFPPWLASQIDHLAEAIGEDLEVLGSERHLLYVACMQARDRLLITGTRQASEFLGNIQQ